MAIVSAAEQLVALFNEGNTGLAHPLTVSDVTIGAAAAYTPADNTDTRNTKLTITAKDDSANFSGVKELHYTRLPAAIIGNKSVTAEQSDWDTDAKVLAIFNNDVVAVNAEDTFAAAEVTIARTDGDNGDKVITVAINNATQHLKYLGGVAATYTVKQVVNKTDLSSTNGELNGFTE